jgi:ATP-binding cassette subfamily B multidrug efflux pump
LLFSMMAHVLDLLGKISPAELWQQHGHTLALLAAVLVASIGFVAAQALFKYQGVFSNFPMRLRWNFHRLMLEQSMSFYQDEFAGRIATKVMQTSLAVRDTWLIVTDILVYVVIYFVTMLAVLGGFDMALVLPFLGWLAAYLAGAVVLRAAPGQGGAGAGRRPVADDRPHHRRVHQHRHRQAVLARAPRGRPSPARRCRSSWSRPTARCAW